MRKKVLVIISDSPYQSGAMRSGLDYCLAASAFEQDISLLLLNDASYVLLKGQTTESIQIKNLSKTLSALPIYGVDKIYVCESTIKTKGISHHNSILPITCLNDKEITGFASAFDHVLSF